jgi:hypothetical protein
MLMRNKDLYFLIGAFLMAFLLAGIISRFHYLDALQIQLHDSSLQVFPIYFGLLLWAITTFLIYVFRGFRNKFSSKIGTIILLISNSVLMISIAIISYGVYAFFATVALLDIFIDSESFNLILEKFTWTMTTFAILITLSVTLEILLVRQLRTLMRKI